MKVYDKKRKILCLMLVFALITGLFFGPSGAFPAKAEESGTNPDDGANVEVTQQTIWYWHKGLPPADGNQYRVLLVWKDQYFLNCTAEFYTDMVNAISGSARLVNSPYNNTNGQHNGTYKKVYWQAPKGMYAVEVSYSSGAGKSSVAALDFDFNVLKQTGTAVSFEMPDSIPVMQHYPPHDDLTEFEKDNGFLPAERVLIGMTPTQEMLDSLSIKEYAGFKLKADEINWLCALKWMDYHLWKEDGSGLYGLFGGKVTIQRREYRWCLLPAHSDSYKQVVQSYNFQFQNISSARENGLVYDNLDLAWWYASEHNGKYVFSSRGFNTKFAGSTINTDYDDYKYLRFLSEDEANMYLGYSTSDNACFATYGNRIEPYRFKFATDEYNHNSFMYASQEYGGAIERYDFDVYYAEPNLMYYLNNDIVVENGQVQNLDGPMVIQEGTVITVKDGGVLSLTDWIVNNGQILIEPGGTMIVQGVQTENWTRNSVVVPSVKDKGTVAGRISCDGVMIVMPGCTLAGGGIYGLEFGEGAQCVNYGNLISENWNVYTDHTVESRSAEASVRIGSSIIDSGFCLMSVPLDQASSSLGKWQDGGTANVASDWLYGNGRWSRTSGNQYVMMPNRRGRVTAGGPAAN